MKVLWFEISRPSGYIRTERVVMGWQDALENIVRKYSDIELYIAFENDSECEIKKSGNVTYVPFRTHYSFWERKKNDFTWQVNEHKVIKESLAVVDFVKPDIIHVFGNEWPYGLIAQYTNIPVVIHIQGSIISYNNALYPPGYNIYTSILSAGINLRKQWNLVKKYYKDKSRLHMENRVWTIVSNYMGRTDWDRALVNVLHANATYHHVDEALRPEFLLTSKKWTLKNNYHIKLLTTGCSSFWKGIDVMLKTAFILKNNGVNFVWNVAGSMPNYLQKIVEKKEKLRFADNNINILGFTSPEVLIDLLCESTMYVHTAYIENSPNSICEAQFLGVPVVSTMVGGISSLVRNGKDGILLPANDPWQMANAILELSKNIEKMQKFSESSYVFARERHSPQKIYSQLLRCYEDLLK